MLGKVYFCGTLKSANWFEPKLFWLITSSFEAISPMKNNKFYLYSIVLTLVLALLLAGFQNFQQQIVVSNLAWVALAYFYLLTIVTYLITNSALPKDNKTFIYRTYGAIGIRFVFSIFPLFIYLIFSPERQLSFAVVYLFLYFFYTAFEIYFLVVNLRPDLKK